MTIEWTPKEERSRDRWRKRGGLATIQAERGYSRQELADHFALMAKAKENGFNTIEEYLSSLDDLSRAGVENTQLYQLAIQFGQIKK